MTDRKIAGPTGDPVYLHAAMLCNQVIRGDDGAVSFIRKINQTRFALPVLVDSNDVAPVKVTATATLVIIFTSISYRGKKLVGLTLHDPTGNVQMTQPGELSFEGDTDLREAGILFDLRVQIDRAGLYWIDVTLDGEFVTRVPWSMMFDRTRGELESS